MKAIPTLIKRHYEYLIGTAIFLILYIFIPYEAKLSVSILGCLVSSFFIHILKKETMSTMTDPFSNRVYILKIMIVTFALILLAIYTTFQFTGSWGIITVKGIMPADWLLFWGEFLSFVGSAILGIVVIIQNESLKQANDKANARANKLLEMEHVPLIMPLCNLNQYFTIKTVTQNFISRKKDTCYIFSFGEVNEDDDGIVYSYFFPIQNVCQSYITTMTIKKFVIRLTSSDGSNTSLEVDNKQNKDRLLSFIDMTVNQKICIAIEYYVNSNVYPDDLSKIQHINIEIVFMINNMYDIKSTFSFSHKLLYIEGNESENAHSFVRVVD